MNKELRDQILSFKNPTQRIEIFGHDIETFDREMLIATCHLLAQETEQGRLAAEQDRHMREIVQGIIGRRQ